MAVRLPPLEQWRVLRSELRAYNPSLLQRPAAVLLTKIDCLLPSGIQSV